MKDTFVLCSTLLECIKVLHPSTRMSRISNPRLYVLESNETIPVTNIYEVHSTLNYFRYTTNVHIIPEPHSKLRSSYRPGQFHAAVESQIALIAARSSELYSPAVYTQ